MFRCQRKDGSRIIKNCPQGCSACVTTLERYPHSARRHSSLPNEMHPRTQFVPLSNMNINKSEKCLNTIGTINLPPQLNRPQQGLLYALHTTKGKSKQQARAKQHSNHFLCYVVHEAWRSSQHLCCRAVSLVARKQCAIKHVGASRIAMGVGREPR